MGVYAYQFEWQWPASLTDQQQEDMESQLASNKLDLFDDFSYKYERSSSQPKFTQEEAFIAALSQAQKIIASHPDLEIQVVRARYCGCCPTEVYERFSPDGQEIL